MSTPDHIVLHASDLHFGRHQPQKVTAVLSLVSQTQPDAVVLSGDFTQIGSRKEFSQARGFLDELKTRFSGPVVTTPGNHDLSVRNLLVRAMAPFARYRTHIAPHLRSSVRIGHLSIIAARSAHRFGRARLSPLGDWSRGRLLDSDLNWALAERKRLGGNAAWLVIHHHPWRSMTDAGLTAAQLPPDTLERLSGAGFTAILTGHTHLAGQSTRGNLTNISAGTAFSNRWRGEGNSINRIHLDANGQIQSVEAIAI